MELTCRMREKKENKKGEGTFNITHSEICALSRALCFCVCLPACLFWMGFHSLWKNRFGAAPRSNFVTESLGSLVGEGYILPCTANMPMTVILGQELSCHSEPCLSSLKTQLLQCVLCRAALGPSLEASPVTERSDCSAVGERLSPAHNSSSTDYLHAPRPGSRFLF